ncbi:MAG: tetratricopeptide repeat protein [Limisphaerales bacterium]
MRPIVLPAVVALAALGTLFGCASAKKAQAPTPAKTATAAVVNAPLSKEEMEKRVEALARFAAGVSSELREQPDEALDQFYKSVLADPTNEPLVIDVARRLIRKKDSAKAIEILSKCAEQRSATGFVDALLGIAYQQAGKTDLAIAASRRTIAKLPKAILGFQNLATIYLQTNRPKEALAALDEAAALGVTEINFLLELGEAYRNYVSVQPREFEAVKPKVMATIEAATKLDPKGQNLIFRLAELFSFAGEYKRAAELYVKLLERFPNQAILRNRIVELYLRANDIKAAQAQLDALVREQPTNPLAHYFLGAIAAEQRNWEKAIEYYSKTIQLNEGAPQDFEPVYYDLAGVHITNDDPEEALKVLEKARKKFKNTFLLEFYSALAHSRAKDYAASIKHFTAAELLAKRDEPERLTPLFFFQVGTAYERHKDFKQAENYFRQTLKLAPDFAEALNYLGYMWAERGENLTEAKEMIAKAVKQEPENAAFLDSMAWVLFKLNQPKEALEYQLKALKHQKEPDATLHDHLGDIYLALKEPQKARDQWEQALTIEPSEAIQKKLKAAPAKP